MLNINKQDKVFNGIFFSKFLGKNKAFTLAEVLITLGIIGVVAAMTIPNLISSYKAIRLRSQFVKSYSTVQQAFKRMEGDGVSLDSSTYGYTSFYKSFVQYFHVATDCGAFATNSSYKYLPCFYANYNDPEKNKNVKYYRTLSGAKARNSYLNNGQFVLQD